MAAADALKAASDLKFEVKVGQLVSEIESQGQNAVLLKKQIKDAGRLLREQDETYCRLASEHKHAAEKLAQATAAELAEVMEKAAAAQVAAEYAATLQHQYTSEAAKQMQGEIDCRQSSLSASELKARQALSTNLATQSAQISKLCKVAQEVAAETENRMKAAQALLADVQQEVVVLQSTTVSQQHAIAQLEASVQQGMDRAVELQAALDFNIQASVGAGDKTESLRKALDAEVQLRNKDREDMISETAAAVIQLEDRVTASNLKDCTHLKNGIAHLEACLDAQAGLRQVQNEEGDATAVSVQSQASLTAPQSNKIVRNRLLLNNALVKLGAGMETEVKHLRDEVARLAALTQI